MAKRVRALVDGAILKWARESGGYSIEEIAARFGKDAETIRAWEEDEETYPYMGQLRDLANLYKRSISDFYLPAPPDERPIPHDFRRAPGEVAGTYSPDLRKQLRFARERQELTEFLYEELGEKIELFGHGAKLTEKPEALGQRIRELLGVQIEKQFRWRDPYAALKGWRRPIESLGVLVFQFENVAADEAWGFSIVEGPMPVIGVNIDLAPNGRTFTMLHEFVHVLLGKNSICDIDDFTARGEAELRVEVFCNQVAAATLMPRGEFLAHDVVASRDGPVVDWGDDEIAEVAVAFSVSREAVVRRLLTFGKTTQAFYQQKRAQYKAQRDAQKQRVREESKGKHFGQNRAQRALSNFGPTYVGAVLSSYSDDRITLADAAKFLEVRAPAVRKVEELVLRG